MGGGECVLSYHSVWLLRVLQLHVWVKSTRAIILCEQLNRCFDCIVKKEVLSAFISKTPSLPSPFMIDAQQKKKKKGSRSQEQRPPETQPHFQTFETCCTLRCQDILLRGYTHRVNTRCGVDKMQPLGEIIQLCQSVGTFMLSCEYANLGDKKLGCSRCSTSDPVRMTVRI